MRSEFAESKKKKPFVIIPNPLWSKSHTDKCKFHALVLSSLFFCEEKKIDTHTHTLFSRVSSLRPPPKEILFNAFSPQKKKNNGRTGTHSTHKTLAYTVRLFVVFNDIWLSSFVTIIYFFFLNACFTKAHHHTPTHTHVHTHTHTHTNLMHQ